MKCRVRVADESLHIQTNASPRIRFDIDCHKIPGFKKILDIIYTVTAKLKLHNISFLQFKLRGVTSKNIFDGDVKELDYWYTLDQQLQSEGDSTIKILEMNSRIEGGIVGDSQKLSEFLRLWQNVMLAFLYSL